MTEVFFGMPAVHGGGKRPRVGVAGTRVVEVHQTGPNSYQLGYRVGRLEGRALQLDANSHRFGDRGLAPAVALNREGTVVAVYASDASRGSVFYQVGHLGADPGRPPIDFGPQSPAYDRGSRPQVAMNDHGVVVCVHQGIEPGTVFCVVGTVDRASRTIRFGGIGGNTAGWTPAVALNNANEVVVAYQRPVSGAQALWYRVGVVDPASATITLGPEQRIMNGSFPSVALDDEGWLLAVYEGTGDEVRRNLWGRSGRLEGRGLPADRRSLRWVHEAFQYHDGRSPSVGLGDGGVAVQVNDVANALWHATSIEIDRVSWMADRLAWIGSKKLSEIAMPGSHDAGMLRVHQCSLGASSCNTQTQNVFIYDQIRLGCRYFDLRPAVRFGEIHTGHFSIPRGLNAIGCMGETMARVLSDVRRYLEDGGKDLVILKFSHYRDVGNNRTHFTPAQMRRLVDQVTSALGGWLYRGPVPPGGLHSLTVNDYIAGGGKVLAVFTNLQDLRDPSRGLYSFSGPGGGGDLMVFDQFTNTVDWRRMRNDQLAKLRNPANHGGNLFLLSWTVTQDRTRSIRCTTNRAWSIFAMAQNANANLWHSLVDAYHRRELTAELMPNVVYIDFILRAQTDYVIALNEEILGPTH